MQQYQLAGTSQPVQCLPVTYAPDSEGELSALRQTEELVGRLREADRDTQLLFSIPQASLRRFRQHFDSSVVPVPLGQSALSTLYFTHSQPHQVPSN